MSGVFNKNIVNKIAKMEFTQFMIIGIGASISAKYPANIVNTHAIIFSILNAKGTKRVGNISPLMK